MRKESLISLIEGLKKLEKSSLNESAGTDYQKGLFRGNAVAYKICREMLENYLPYEEQDSERSDVLI